MDKSDLKKLKDGALSVDEYQSVPMPVDIDKVKALAILTRETKLVSDEEKRLFDEEMQEKRYELEKDKVYSAQNFEEKKFKAEEARAERDLELKEEGVNLEKGKLRFEKLKHKSSTALEQAKLELEKVKILHEQETLKFNQENAKQERKWKILFEVLRIALPLLTTVFGLIIYRKLALLNLQLIYKDEGRTTQEFSNALKGVERFIKMI